MKARLPVKPQPFIYEKPVPREGDKREVVRLCQTRGVRGSIHVIREGGGENMHSHDSVDGFWMVLAGRVAFYGDGDVELGEFGPLEGILLPRGNRYRFESVGEGDAEIVQVLRIEEDKGFEREDHEEPVIKKGDIPVYYGIKRNK
jgi:mannose-6-phosphate isomerase-like protein (cupin superfamily)